MLISEGSWLIAVAQFHSRVFHYLCEFIIPFLPYMFITVNHSTWQIATIQRKKILELCVNNIFALRLFLVESNWASWAWVVNAWQALMMDTPPLSGPASLPFVLWDTEPATFINRLQIIPNKTVSSQPCTTDIFGNGTLPVWHDALPCQPSFPDWILLLT